MLVKIEYITKTKIGDAEIPMYVTDDSVVYVGKEIIPFLERKTKVKQLIITDEDNSQYAVFPFVEVCKYLKSGDYSLQLNRNDIEYIEDREIPDEKLPEFIITLRNMGALKLGKKKK